MADAIVSATALLNDAELVTGDRDFAALPGVSVSGSHPEAVTGRFRLHARHRPRKHAAAGRGP